MEGAGCRYDGLNKDVKAALAVENCMASKFLN